MRIIFKALLILLLLTVPSFAQRSLNVVKSTQTLSAGSSIDCSGPKLGGGTIVTAKIAGNGGAVDLTSNPQIVTSGRTAGDICYLLGTSDTNTVKIDTGTGVIVTASITFTNNKLEQFNFDGTNWIHTPSSLGGGGAVDSVFTRTGAVTAATSDYDAVQVDNTAAGTITATNVQAALDELDTEKIPNTRTISTTAPIEGGGDLGANRTFSISINNLTDKPTPAGTDRLVAQQPTGEFRRVDIGNLPVPTIDLEDLSDVAGTGSCTDDQVLKCSSSVWGPGTDATGGGGSSPALDLGDNGVNESSGLGEIATTGDTNNIFTEPANDKLLIDASKDWPKADMADDVECTNCIEDADLASTFAKESFKTWDAPSGTDPVADTAADTMTTAAGLGLSLTGDSTADSLTWAFAYGLTLAGNAALVADACVFSTEGAGGGFLCEGSVPDNFEGLFKFPDVTGADATRTVAVVPTSFTENNCVKFDANGQPVDSGGTCGGGASLTVEEVDASPSVANVDKIKYDQADGFVLTDLTAGDVRVDITGIPVGNMGFDPIEETELDALGELNTQLGGTNLKDTGTLTDTKLCTWNNSTGKIDCNTNPVTSLAAAAITNTPAGNIAATDVQAAINELDSEKLATGANAAGLACTDCVALGSETTNNYVANVATTSPLSGGSAGSEGASLTLTIADAAADGSTKGAASFTAADFNTTSGNVAIDYTNGQAASGSNKGFLASADWTTFNNKLSTGTAVSNIDLGGQKVFCDLRPQGNEPPAASFATMFQRNSHPGLSFDGNVCAIWTCVLSSLYQGNGVTVEFYTVSSGTANDLDWDGSWERIEATQDIDSDGFATAISADNNNNSGTSGVATKVSMAFTNGAQMDSCAAGELCRFRLCRDDTADTTAATNGLAVFIGGQIKETP